MICRMYPADFKSGPFQEDAPTNLVVAPSMAPSKHQHEHCPIGNGKPSKQIRHFDVSSSVRLHWFGSHRVGLSKGIPTLKRATNKAQNLQQELFHQLPRNHRSARVWSSIFVLYRKGRKTHPSWMFSKKFVNVY